MALCSLSGVCSVTFVSDCLLMVGHYPCLRRRLQHGPLTSRGPQRRLGASRSLDFRDISTATICRYTVIPFDIAPDGGLHDNPFRVGFLALATLLDCIVYVVLYCLFTTCTTTVVTYESTDYKIFSVQSTFIIVESLPNTQYRARVLGFSHAVLSPQMMFVNIALIVLLPHRAIRHGRVLFRFAPGAITQGGITVYLICFFADTQS